ncbi:MAG: DapH/DapD/GlmU-related protein [Pirellulaceae bacterium]
MPYNFVDHARLVSIGRGVWVGYRALIVPGVTIDDGAVIAAGAVVTRDVGKGQIVGGNPAQLLKVRENVGWIDSAIKDQQYYLRAKDKGLIERRFET